MKLKYKILFILLLLLTLFIIDNNKIYATNYDLSSYININDHYAIYRGTDNNVYLVKANPDNRYHLSYVPENNHILSARDNTSMRYGGIYLYLFSNGIFNYIDEFGRREADDEYKDLYNVAEVLYCYDDIMQIDTDIIYCNSNPIIDFTNVDINYGFTPVLDYIEFIETLDGYFLRTNPLDYNLYGSNFTSDYYLMMYDYDSQTWINSNAICNWISYEVDGVTTSGLQLSYPVTVEGEYIFRLQHKENSELVSNSVSYSVSDFSLAKKYWYDVTAPIYSYGFENNKAIVYTNYIPVEYYDNCLLCYAGDDGKFHVFVSSIISKEYNTDKTMFRFKLQFEEPVSYSCRFVLNGEAGFYYTDTTSFTITESFFTSNGYKEEQSFLGMIGEWLKNFFVGIFVPSSGYLETKISELGDTINTKIPYQQYLEDFEQLSEIEASEKDITVSADLSGYKVSEDLTINQPDFLDFSFLSKYQDVWFSWIRVVTYIGLIIFNINMLMKFLRGFSLAGGSVSSSSSNNKKEG